ncbi:hypothetical protein EAG_01129 [Camponotus floridanus]|uniref:DH domain-containing protein n=1 Tax=Camponotus floridanus TaxID=104421 RepID=E1ZWN5_CAMFO|nr:hypothetical protein EAG_01129 [Camponotus floridanus]
MHYSRGFGNLADNRSRVKSHRVKRAYELNDLNYANSEKDKSSQLSQIRETAYQYDLGNLELSASSPGAISSVVAPILLKYRVCRPRLLLAGSRAEVDPAADVALLHGEVLLIEDFARQYNAIGDTDRRYRATEKLLHAEEEYHEILCSAKELYARPLARSYPEFHDVIFQPLADLSRVSAEHCQRVSQ